MHGDQEQTLAPRGVIRIGLLVGEEVGILQRQRGQVAGAYPEHRDLRGFGHRRREPHPLVLAALAAPQQLARRECHRFEGLGADRPVEQPLAFVFEAIAAGPLAIAQTARQGVEVGDGVVDNGAVARLRSDPPVPLSGQDVVQPGQLVPGQKTLNAHESPSWWCRFNR